LEQALRIRSLSDAKEQALLAELLALFTTWRQPLAATAGRGVG
jgi:hypothetical protein